MIVRAMAQAGEMLFVAGPPDLLDEEEAAQRLGAPEIQQRIVAQDAALEGLRGGLLRAVSIVDGSTLGELRLESAPECDSMAVAGKCLFLSTVDGKVVCFKAAEQ